MFCACSSGGNDNEVDFELTTEILTKGYWYSNIYLDDNYTTKDGLDAIKFEIDGSVKQMDMSGMREYNVGKWKLDAGDIKVTLGEDEQEWRVIEESSSENYLKLYVGNSAFKEYYRTYDFLNGLSADAYVVNEYELDGTYQAKSWFGYRFAGKNVNAAKAILSDRDVALIAKNGVFLLDGESVSEGDYIDGSAVGKSRIRFYANVDGNKVKLSDSIYAENIDHLNYVNILATHSTGSNTVNVTWGKIVSEDSEILSRLRYRIELYPDVNGKKDLANPVFVSANLSANTEKFEIAAGIAGANGKAPDFSLLSAGGKFYVVVSAILYEPGINPDFGINKDLNIQAVSSFTKEESQW
jgi:hypothetical protein